MQYEGLTGEIFPAGKTIPEIAQLGLVGFVDDKLLDTVFLAGVPSL